MQRARTRKRTRACAHTRVQTDRRPQPSFFGTARYSGGFWLLLIFGSFQLQKPEPELFSAPLPDPPN